ncbi:MAG: M28 family peptidase [Candidatus Thorarchaeota archaeon]|nr:M28 family peptidase [Candidatus Thorarchaeota archaeon]
MAEIESIRKHVQQLSVVIGPRGSTTPEEKEAAEYAAGVYKNLGLEPIIERFTSAKSAWRPFALGTLLVLIGEALFQMVPFYGPIVASLLTGLALVSLVLELSFRANPFRWVLPKGESQNVSAAIEPSGDVRQTVAIVGHIDTHRMPISYSSLRWLSIFKSLTTITFLSVILILVVSIIGIFFDMILLRFVSLLLLVPVLVLFLMAVSADRTSYSPGANDNATGASIVIGLAERLLQDPLSHTRVWAVNTGCEEVGSYGAAAWIDSHRADLDSAVFITIDNVGGAEAGPCYLSKETLIFPFESDPELIRIAGEVSKAHPDLGAYSTEMKGAYTDGAIGIKEGLRCLTFVGYRKDGVIPNWHQPSDVIENVDWNTVHRTYEFVWHLLRHLDRNAS